MALSTQLQEWTLCRVICEAAINRSKKRAELLKKNPAPPEPAAVLPAAAQAVTTAGRVVRPAKKLQDYYT